jgi:hypothetical protein
MLKVIRYLLLAAATAYVGVAGYVYVQQRSLQYFPANKGLAPADVGLGGVSEERIRTPDGELITAWYSPPRGEMPTILFFHGNGGEVSDRAERLAFYRERGFGALFVSYRGYGKSSGRISEQGIVTDAVAAYDWLLARGLTQDRIVVVGESLGSGVAVQAAAQRPVAALALEAPYTATVDVAAGIYWWLPVRFMMKDTYLSREFIAQVKAPLLVQHGDADEIIPVGQGRKLFDLANEPKELVILPGEGHGVIHDPAIWEREADFFSRRMIAAQ